MLRIAFAALVVITAPAMVAAQHADSLAPLASISLPPEVDRVLRDYERAWAAGDEKALAALFTEDGFVPDRSGWVRGRQAIETVYQRSQGALRLRALAFAVQDTVGYIVGAYGYTAQPERDAGKFILALRRRPGDRWLIAADLDSGNRP